MPEKPPAMFSHAEMFKGYFSFNLCLTFIYQIVLINNESAELAVRWKTRKRCISKCLFTKKTNPKKLVSW